jgi:hypothetical protein
MLGVHFTLELAGFQPLISKNLSLVENADTIPLHFTPELYGRKYQGSFEWVENLHGFLHGNG